MADSIKLVCAQCGTINQFPGSRQPSLARCGKCKSALVTGKPDPVGAAALARHIQHSGIPVLVDFWAPWCGPCKAFSPVFAQFAADHSGKVRCLKLDTENNQSASSQYGIRSIPTLALFDGGREINRISGALNAGQLADWVDRNLAE